MKVVIFFSFLGSVFASCAQVADQNGEFPIYNNGLIYDQQTMNRLEIIVDSLNLKFKTCEPKAFRAYSQGYAVYVEVKTGGAKARKAMDENISLENFIKQFPGADVKPKEWIYRERYEDYEQMSMVLYSSLPLDKRSESVVRVKDLKRNNKNNGWVYEEYNGKVSAFYLLDLQTPLLPQQYAKHVQYVDCMIDTTATIYLGTKAYYRSTQFSSDSHISKFLTMADQFKGKPKEPKIDWDSPEAETKYNQFYAAMQKWDEERLAALDKKMQNGIMRNYLKEAVDEAVNGNVGDAQLEFYVARYMSADEALQMKRMRQPVGMCSQDRSPRIHAAEICKLAAVTASWDIFLRAHLDIMNDNFDRVSDGSYAWAGRGTYFKELEMLDINSIDLLIGTTLRSENTSANHYYAHISRVGRALSETSNPDELEARLVSMINDPELDLFNRLLIAYVFKHYNYNLKDDQRKTASAELLKHAVAALPDQIGDSILSD